MVDGRPSWSQFCVSSTSVSHLLVIDDERATRAMVHDCLGPFGDVVYAGSAGQARRIVAQGDVELVVIESQLADGSGLDVLGQIRRGDPRLPVVVVTGFGSPAVCSMALELGATDYFQKPVDPTALRRCLHRCLAIRRTGDVRLVSVLAHIEDGYRQPLTLTAVARSAGLGPFALARAFHRAFGVSLRTYVALLRIHNARTLLVQTDTSVAEIGASVGFADPAHFTALFEKHMGVSPTLYRRQRVITRPPPSPR